MLTVMFLSLFLLLFATTPIFASLAGCVIIVCRVFFPGTSMDIMLGQAMVTSIDSFPLMAIPYFMLVGSLMERTGIAEKLVNVAKIITGDKPGGLGMAAIVAATFFAAISGSGPATTAAIGGIMIPAMIQQKYSRDYCGSLVASASTIGPVIPPSIPMIMFGVTVGVSVTDLFIGGFFPGIMMAASLMIYNYFLSKKRGYKGETLRYSAKEKTKIIKSALWALVMPVIVLGGIYAGIFTPTESAVIGVVYALFVGGFVYKTLTWDVFKKSLVEAAITSATIMVLFGGANTFGRLMSIGKIPQVITAGMLSMTQSPFVLMLLINLVLIAAGMFWDTISSIILLAPLFTPIVVQIGYDPVFFGVIMTINLCIGMLTPPLGANLFVAMRISGSTFENVLKEAMPCIGILLIVLFVLIAFPQIIMVLPNLLKM